MDYLNHNMVIPKATIGNIDQYSLINLYFITGLHIICLSKGQVNTNWQVLWLIILKV